MVALIDATIKI